MLKGRTAIELAADLSAGLITEDLIKEQLGEGMLSSVLAVGGGLVAGGLASYGLHTIDKHTGIISDLSSVVDDVFSIFD